jgi:hypothetical protein
MGKQEKPKGREVEEWFEKYFGESSSIGSTVDGRQLAKSSKRKLQLCN